TLWRYPRSLTRIELLDIRTLLSGLLDDDVAGLVPNDAVIGRLMVGHEQEGARPCAYLLVLLARQEDDLGATLVVALAEVGGAAAGERQLVGPLLQLFVHLSEG